MSYSSTTVSIREKFKSKTVLLPLDTGIYMTTDTKHQVLEVVQILGLLLVSCIALSLLLSELFH
jgi:hypothetical protein